jgi:hypothetical protein
MDLTVVLGASVAVNRFVEFIKPYIDKLGFSEDVRKGVLVLVSVLVGILIALLSNGAVNIFTSVPALPPIAGQILTGVLAGFGADVLNAFVKLLYWRDNLPASASK